jgi:RIO kinase 1
MSDALEPLLADGVVDAVHGRLKSGKEADLWLVRHAGEIVAAKIYKARERRSFKNDAGYREGRRVRDSRTQRAMDRGSRFGRGAAEDAWKAKEWDALYALHAAGVRVPRPLLFHEGVLLMELVLDAHGHPAPRLVDAPVRREDAAALYADLRTQAVRMLCCDLVHGDLSPYNILLGASGPMVIDFPQVVGAAHNSQAERYFLRDLENVRGFFAAIDPALRAAAGDGREIWRAYARRELTPDFVPAARPEVARTPEPPHARAEGRRREHPRGRGAPPRHRPDATRTERRGAFASERPRDEAQRGGPSRGGRHGRGAVERPSPEVIRVVRPPSNPPAVATSAAQGHLRPTITPAPAPGAPRPEGHRRRRGRGRHRPR